MDRRRTPALAACLLVAGLALTGCGSAADAAAQAGPDEPARVVHLTGSQRSAVVLTADAARRIGVTTASVTAAPSAGAGSAVAVPLDALLYDKDGRTWVYTTAKPLTFVPTQVTVAHIDGDTATLSAGPAVGTQVVTVGGAELVGVEYGVPGEQ